MNDLSREALLDVARRSVPSAEHKAALKARIAQEIAAAPLGGAATSSAAASGLAAAPIKLLLAVIAAASLAVAAIGIHALGNSAEPRLDGTHLAPSSAPLPALAEARRAPELAPTFERAPPAARPTLREAPASTGADAFLAELRLLEAAQQALDSDRAAESLRVLDRHQRRFPHTTLEPEARALRALVLCRLGRADEARRVARPLLDSDHPARRRVAESCAAEAGAE